ncbi:uncharacterized protein VTP21DRAFT_5466 [Calcarisporiella thermophila]|uniref:uncharacterized protein n=1 Tax=Calcarisporiella thermophila TaxID=911321 RepID=UPI0037439646
MQTRKNKGRPQSRCTSLEHGRRTYFGAVVGLKELARTSILFRSTARTSAGHRVPAMCSGLGNKWKRASGLAFSCLKVKRKLKAANGRGRTLLEGSATVGQLIISPRKAYLRLELWPQTAARHGPSPSSPASAAARPAQAQAPSSPARSGSGEGRVPEVAEASLERRARLMTRLKQFKACAA